MWELVQAIFVLYLEVFRLVPELLFWVFRRGDNKKWNIGAIDLNSY